MGLNNFLFKFFYLDPDGNFFYICALHQKKSFTKNEALQSSVLRVIDARLIEHNYSEVINNEVNKILYDVLCAVIKFTEPTPPDHYLL